MLMDLFACQGNFAPCNDNFKFMLQKGKASSRSMDKHNTLLPAIKASNSSRVPCHFDLQSWFNHVNALSSYGKHWILFKLKMYIAIHVVSLQTFLRIHFF